LSHIHKHVLIGVAATLLSWGSVNAVRAQAPAAVTNYPDKTIRIVVPSTPAGGNDFLARVLGAKLAKMWGQKVLIENRPGAGGIIGSEAVAKAEPDGYTLLIVATGYTVNPSIYAKLPYDTLKDFAPVTLLASTTHVLVINPAVKARSIGELMAQARSAPGSLTYAQSGLGTGGYLCGELMKTTAQIDMLSIAYKGAGEAVSGVLSGHTDMLFTQLGPVMNHIKAGKLIPLATTSLTRNADLPNIPTLDESGLTGFEVDAWSGILAPAGTPAAIIKKLQEQIHLAINEPDVKEILNTQGFIPIGNTPAEFDKMIRKDIAKWADLIKQAGIKPQGG
jgi:tripartite-type tricarboxylate transporter receptor subunit TctC